MWRAMKINTLGRDVNELIINDTAYLFVDGLLLAVCLPREKAGVEVKVLYRETGYGFSNRQRRAFNKFCEGWATEDRTKVDWDTLNCYAPVEPTKIIGE